MLVTRRGVEEVKGFMKMLLHNNDVFTVLLRECNFRELPVPTKLILFSFVYMNRLVLHV